MPRETFQQELDDLIDEVIELGLEVENSLENMLKAMESQQEVNLAQKELGLDIHYKGTRSRHRARVHDIAGSPGSSS
jgi:phosphate transport system protein